jgi:alpha-maltose-1-phosphate synthase
MMNPAIYFEPDGYVLSGDKLMGRHAAGNAFLRAVVAGRDNLPLWVYTPSRRSAEVFRKLVTGFDPATEMRWIPANRLDLLHENGLLSIPGPGLDAAAFLRLREGSSAYSICGVTHTTASHGAMDSIAGLLHAPVMEWDALICTSSAVRDTVSIILEKEQEYLQWRFGFSVNPPLPQLPVIPLGVHCDDFRFSSEERRAAREALGIGSDAIVALFAGRLSFHAKAHPYAMYAALQASAGKSGKEIVLVQSGWFANDHIDKAFRSGAESFSPQVRVLFTDGRKPDERRQSWAVADIFLSLSDNIQETFGLTPIEAMAAGIPAVVTDWNGYKDTVRDGVDGFRISTRMPHAGYGEMFARAYECGTMSYDTYCGYACQTVSVDLIQLTERLVTLCTNHELRRTMGDAARERVINEFEWRVIYQRYRELWRDLAGIRRRATGASLMHHSGIAQPSTSPARLDPFMSFRHYASASIGKESVVSLVSGADIMVFRKLAQHPLFSYAVSLLPSEERVTQLFRLLSTCESCTAAYLCEALGLDECTLVNAIAMLAKMGIVRLKT